MYLTPQEVVLEVAIVAFINVFVIYTAAFSYSLDWRAITGVIVLASLLTASFNSMFLKSVSMTKVDEGALIGEAMGIMLVSALSSLAVFIVLVYRFDFLTAVGLSLLSGFLLSLIRTLTAKL